MSKNNVFLIVMICLGAFFSLPSHANDDDLQPGVNAIRFPVTNWQPFTIGSEPPFTGIDVDIARIIAKRLNMKLVLRACPFKRCLKEMELGKLDMNSGVAFNETRAEYLDYIKTPSYGKVSVAFYVRKGRAHMIKAYDDLKNIKVGVVQASHYFEPFNSDTSLRKYEAYTEDMLFPLLESGRVGAIVGTNPNLDFQILSTGNKNKFVAAEYSPQKEVPLYFTISRLSPLMKRKEDIRKILQDLLDDGTLERIYARYR